MKKLSLTDTQSLVSSYVKSFGQCGAAKKLTEKGYRSPEGGQILQAHIYRILHGSGTCILGPETEDQQQQQSIEKPIAPIPKMQKKIAEELFADEELLQQEIAKTASELREELEEERLAIEELERSLPALVPLIEDRLCKQHRHLDRYARVSAVFDRRGDVELEDRDFYGIPRMKHSQPVITICRPHHPRNYGRNTISTRDLSVYQK